ncbi:hypothetical protein G6011_09107 [Alternaria panax]|uniref:Uncharacterized protein n=1 Tax=Alternaria panax TaxID=48097 RepID=A0AAD4NPF5_9PLEO|nr:hypothetical protein G6011_09107 [Alternaria panax]
MVPSTPVAETTTAATRGPIQPDGRVRPSSLPAQCAVSAEVNGNGLTVIAMQTHCSNLNCVGTWATKEECQRIGAPMDSA